MSDVKAGTTTGGRGPRRAATALASGLLAAMALGSGGRLEAADLDGGYAGPLARWSAAAASPTLHPDLPAAFAGRGLLPGLSSRPVAGIDAVQWGARPPLTLALMEAARGPAGAGPLADGGMVEPVVLNSPRLSGLSWRSGASCSDPGFAAWRGRPIDVHVLFTPSATWDSMLTYFRGSYFKGKVRLSPQPVLSIGLMPRSAARQHAACARGEFDGYFRQFGALIAQAGAGRAVVRPSWEANLGSGTHPWGVDSVAELPAYKACFRRAVAALKQGAPGIKIEWTNAKKGNLPISALDAYPGDDVTDLFGVHYYDNSSRKMGTQAVWDLRYVATHREGPMGLGEWLKAARARGKKLAVPEWGVWDTGDTRAADTPVYIDNMYRFFRANAADIAYENYYNCPQKHRLFPQTDFPQASARYRALWSAGR